MVVYLDLVILSVISVNALIIEAVCCLFGEKVNFIRLIISCIMAVLLQAIYLIPLGNIASIRFLLGIPIGFIAFSKKDYKRKIIQIVVYYLLNLTFVGSLIAFNVRTPLLFVLSLLLTICLFVIMSFKNNNEVYIKINNVNRLCLFDTGNSSYYNNTPIVFLKHKYFNDKYNIVGEIEIYGVGGSAKKIVYTGPPIKVRGSEYKVFYCEIDDFTTYDLILHRDMEGEKRCLNF